MSISAAMARSSGSDMERLREGLREGWEGDQTPDAGRRTEAIYVTLLAGDGSIEMSY